MLFDQFVLDVSSLLCNVANRMHHFQVCDDVPIAPKCSTGRCIIGGGACPQNQAVCSRNEFNFVSSCPLGPGGQQPIQPLGPGGIQPIQPLGPGGIQPIQPLGPGGIQRYKREADAEPQMIRKLVLFIHIYKFEQSN